MIRNPGYISNSNFWLLDLTLNDLNASIQVLFDDKVPGRLDPNYVGFDKVTASVVYGALIIQDVLAYTRSKKNQEDPGKISRSIH
ncbi:MAG: hypothetical protein HRU09_15675 [Oligoflexales bacterium]|nr:hypothetical protein [Oligoflexales bacterium]